MGKKTQKNNKTYTYKEILLALREQMLINQKLLNQLKGLITIEKKAGTYYFYEILQSKNDMFYNPYNIYLHINVIEGRQSKLKKIINEITHYKFLKKYELGGYHTYRLDDNQFFHLTAKNHLEDYYFGEIKITDKEKFDDIAVQLYNSKLSKLMQEGIHVTDDLYLGIDQYIEIAKEHNLVFYQFLNDGIKTNINDESFIDILNTKIDSALLYNELINILEGSNYKDADVQFTNNNDLNHLYKFEENGKSITLK